MTPSSHHDFRAMELDPALLSTSYEVQTNWHVITGAPCSGKTTLVDQLADKGFRTVLEIARVYFEREMAKGRTFEEIREDRAGSQRGIFDLQLGFERRLPVNEVMFLDRALPDVLTFCRAYGMNPNEMLPECFHYRYASIFLLAPLPFQGNGARDGDAAEVAYLDEWLARDYAALGYDVVRVPVLEPQERLAFVLEML